MTTHTSIPTSGEERPKNQRRYDVDALRTIALGLLIIYHSAMVFQPWAMFTGLIINEEPLESLWLPMSLINVWRMPIVFVISGMGVAFATRRRTWTQFLSDRTMRILLPLVFCTLTIGPLNEYIYDLYQGNTPSYRLHPGHLWFLGHIYLYAWLMLPIIHYFRRFPDNDLVRMLQRAVRNPNALFLTTVPLVIVIVLINPASYTSYAGSLHGFVLGIVCFVQGYIFVSMGAAFWVAVEDFRWRALAGASILFCIRIIIGIHSTTPLLPMETILWILTLLGFSAHYLNRPSALLAYLSAAVYPVYIVHLPIQLAVSFFIFPLALPAWFKFVVLVGGTLGISIVLYEIILKRIPFIRPLFGMKYTTRRRVVTQSG